MAKKNVAGGRPDKRAKRRVVAGTPVPAGAAVAVSTPTIMPGASRPTWMAPVRASGRSGGVIRDEEYRYIYGDLRRIGILAGSAFAALIILSFVLR